MSVHMDGAGPTKEVRMLYQEVGACLPKGSLTKNFQQLKLRGVSFSKTAALHHLHHAVLRLMLLQEQAGRE